MKEHQSPPHAIHGIQIAEPALHSVLKLQGGAIINERGPFQTPFFGHIGVNKRKPYPHEKIDGYLIDWHGKYWVTDLKTGELGSLSFKKGLFGTTYGVTYSFRKNDEGVFIGHWEITDKGVTTLRGEAKCLLTPIPASFLLEQEAKVFWD